MTDTQIATAETSSLLEMLRAKLTPLQARFADEYMIDFNGSQAAVRAGSKAENTRVAAHEFLTNPNVQDYIEEMRRIQRNRARMTADRLLQMLTEEAEADTAELYDADGNIKPIHDWPMVFRRGLVVGIETSTEYERGPDGDARDIGKIAKIKVTDRKGIKELLGRHVGVQAFRENVSLTGAIGVATIPVEKLTEEQLRVIAGLPTKAE